MQLDAAVRTARPLECTGVCPDLPRSPQISPDLPISPLECTGMPSASRLAEIWGDVGDVWERRGDVGRYGEMRGDGGRSGEVGERFCLSRRDLGRCGEIASRAAPWPARRRRLRQRLPALAAPEDESGEDISFFHGRRAPSRTSSSVISPYLPVSPRISPHLLERERDRGAGRRTPRWEMWGDMGRCGETWGDMGRYGEMRGDMGRCGEMWGDVEIVEPAAARLAPTTRPLV